MILVELLLIGMILLIRWVLMEGLSLIELLLVWMFFVELALIKLWLLLLLL